jgi:hypothetical protein
MKPCQKRKKKMNKILLTLGAVALTAFTFNATANDIALSPRAAANQIKTVSGTDNDVTTAVTSAALSPRAAASQASIVSGVNNDRNVATACRNMMTGSSPKAIQACEANAAMPGCHAATVAAK